MYKPYKMPVIKVSPDVKIPEPKISKFMILIIRLLGIAYFRILYGNAKIVLREQDILFDAFKRAFSGESRFIIAFRHPDGREAQLLTYFFLFHLKKFAAKSKIKFKKRPHARFVYGYEVVRWGGWVPRIVMPNLGALPIHHTKMDSRGMARIYKAIIEGPYPLAIAPEGQVSYNFKKVPHLEPGIIRIGLQAASLQKNSNCNIEVVPLSIFFRYKKKHLKKAIKLLKKIEKICGFAESETLGFSKRLERCRDYILEKNENRYGIATDTAEAASQGNLAQAEFEERLDKLIYAAIEKAEAMLGIKGEGDFFARLYRIRHICWDKIFLDGIENLDQFSGLERSIKDLEAGEAWHIARHQELADFAWYFKNPVPREESPIHDKMEYVQNLFDFASRTMGGEFAGRINLPVGSIIIQASKPIDLSSRLEEFKKAKKETAEKLVGELEKAYIDCIEDVNKANL